MLLLLPICAVCSFASSGCFESTAPTDVTPVTRDADVKWLLIDPADATIAPGASLALTATAEDHSGQPLDGIAFQWVTSDSLVARVSSTGVVTGVSRGTAVLQASAGNVTTLATVEVGSPTSPPPNVWVSVSPASQDLIVGQSYGLASVVRDVNGNPVNGLPVSYSSSDASIAVVSPAGVVTAKHPGEAVITAVGGTSRATALANVLASKAASVALSPASITLLPKQTGVFTAKALDSLGNPLNVNSITWTSSSPNVATVDDSGDVMALMPGTTTVTASVGNLHGASNVVVQPSPPTTITLTPSALDVPVGSKARISAVVRDASGMPIVGAPVSWSSNNSGVATVDSTGVVAGVSTGIASIRAQSGSIQSAATVTVLTVPAGSVVVTPGSATIAIGSAATFSATVRDPSGNVLNGRVVTWTSSQPLVATVSPSGVVTAVGPGVTMIDATSAGVTGSATITVPGNPGVDLSHQPTDMTPLTDRDFSTRALSLTDIADAQGWSTGESRYGNFTIVSDASAPRSPPSVAQLEYPAGMPLNPMDSYSPVTAWLPTPPNTHRMYVSMWLKVSSNWRGHNSTANKLMEAFIANQPHCVLGLVGSGSGPLRPSVALNGGPDPRAGEYLPGNVSPSTTFSRGSWHRLEMVIVANTPGVRDGQATWWLDGQLVGDYRDIMWVAAGENGNWIQLELQPIWGGRNDQLVVTQYLWVDHIYASTSP